MISVEVLRSEGPVHLSAKREVLRFAQDDTVFVMKDVNEASRFVAVANAWFIYDETYL